MTLTVEQAAEELKRIVRSASNPANDWAMRDGVDVLIKHIQAIHTPEQFIELRNALLPEPSPPLASYFGDGAPVQDVLARLNVLMRKLEDDGAHVGSNTAWLAIQEISRLRLVSHEVPRAETQTPLASIDERQKAPAQ